MIAFLYLGSFLNPELRPDFLDDVFKDASFTHKSPFRWSNDEEWSSASSKARISGVVSKPDKTRSVQWHIAIDSHTRASRGLIGSPPGGYYGFRHQMPSGLPIGGEGVFLTEDGKAMLGAASTHEEISASLFVWNDPRQNPVTPEEVAWTEHFARILMARGAGLRLSSPTSTVIGGVTVHGFSCRFSSLPFTNLADWAQARGWRVGLSEDKNAETLTKDQHTVVVPLASLSIQIDGKWKDMPDVIAEKDGAWYVPSASLNALD